MADDDLRLSPDLEKVRQLLYGDLSEAEGRAAIIGVFEERARRRELVEDLFRRVRELGEEQD